MRKSNLSRRDFLSASTRTAAALAAGSMLAGRTARAATRKIGANDRIVLGIIGSGGQGLHDGNTACQADNVVCAALADLAEFRMDYAQGVLGDTMAKKGQQGVKIERYNDYRKLLDNKDIDAVVIATPDLWHAEPFIAACQAGKHIYQEKPFSFTIAQGDAMLAAARSRRADHPGRHAAPQPAQLRTGQAVHR